MVTTAPDQAIGQGVVRRFTHTEYSNKTRALWARRFTPADAFPGDVGADGFDNASGPQTVVANHLTAFERGSDKVGSRSVVVTGRHFSYPTNTPCDALYTTMLNALGVPAVGFGAKQSAPRLRL